MLCACHRRSRASLHRLSFSMTCISWPVRLCSAADCSSAAATGPARSAVKCVDKEKGRSNGSFSLRPLSSLDAGALLRATWIMVRASARNAGVARTRRTPSKSQPRTGHTREPDPKHLKQEHKATRKTATPRERTPDRTAIERWHHTRIRGRVARVLLGSHTFAPYSHAEISSEVV